MGPFLETRPSKDGLDAILKRNNIVINESSDKLMILYRSLPIISDYIPFHNLVFDIIKYQIPNLKQVHVHEFSFDTNKASTNFIPISDDQRLISDAMFLERYRVENRLLDAVTNGNLEEALMYNNRFRALTTEYQHFSDLNMVSAYLMSFNTLLRKAIDKAGIHPIFIDHISSQFTKKILTHDFDSTLNSTFLNEMITTYVTSVNEFTYRNLSPLIKDVTKEIDTHISNRLSIHELADKFNVSTTYLSSRFKNEHNITITDFINSKRLLIAKRMLTSFNLPIIEIAMECGFQDQNYFARVFKKTFGITPSQYRSNK